MSVTHIAVNRKPAFQAIQWCTAEILLGRPKTKGQIIDWLTKWKEQEET